MINISGLHKYFSMGQPSEVHALNNISIDVPEEEFLILLGSNGSGKSTLLNVISGAETINTGSIFIDEVDVTSLPEHKRSKWISRVFQNPVAGTASGLTILENFRLAALRSKRKSLTLGTSEAFRKLTASKVAVLNLGLEDKLDQPMGILSGGQRQALTLLMAVMDETRLLLMDEPASALDPRTAEVVMKLAEKITREYKLTTIMVTHSLRDAHSYGDRIIMLAEGQIVKDIRGNEKKKLQPEELFVWF